MKHTSTNARRTWLLGVSAVTLSWAAITGSLGCRAEHRMDLDDFLVRQQEVEQTRAAERAQAPPVQLDNRLGPERLGVGDVVDVTVTGSEGALLFPSIRVRVDRDGRISLPVVGMVEVGDRELVDAEAQIRGAFVPNVYNEATCHVTLVKAAETDVLVTGAVALPGLVSLRRTERNLLYAIAGAGGISPESSGQVTLRRIRHPDEPITFKLTDPMDLRGALALNPLEAGDIVYVHAAPRNTVFVGGLVARSGPQEYPIDSEVTVLQALAAASGLRTDVAPKEGTLVRRMPDGTDAHVRLDLNRIATGEDPNILLAAGDILWVPETLETRIHDFFNRNVFLRAGVSVNYNVSGVEFLNRHRLQSNRGGGSLQDAFDPFGFLGQNSLLNAINTSTAP